MSREEALLLRCPACDWSELCDLVGMKAWLRAHGTLRRAADPEPAMIVELFRGKRELFECPECDTVLLIEAPQASDWAEARTCEACGKAIAEARLTAMPSAVRCAVCQEKVERGEPTGEAEYCSSCGGIMVMRQAGAGITRYVMRCGDCGR